MTIVLHTIDISVIYQKCAVLRNKVLKPVSLSHQAYECIKQKIVSLELPPGSVIDEVKLQEELALGRTPIREALKRLSLEKLVVIIPRRGMFVSDIGITDLQQLFEVRIVLESLAARLAAERGTLEHWDRMQSVLTELPKDNTSNQQLIAIDGACHEIVYAAAGNRFLEDTLVTYYALSQRLWYFFLARIDDMRDAILDHRRILSALRSGNGAEASRLTEQHIHAFHDEIQRELAHTVIQDLPASGGYALQGKES